eukprot:6483459-Amphidinium_carterae.1
MEDYTVIDQKCQYLQKEVAMSIALLACLSAFGLVGSGACPVGPLMAGGIWLGMGCEVQFAAMHSAASGM